MTTHLTKVSKKSTAGFEICIRRIMGSSLQMMHLKQHFDLKLQQQVSTTDYYYSNDNDNVNEGCLWDKGDEPRYGVSFFSSMFLVHTYY